MTELEIDTHLRQTFEDQRLSRGERRSLQQLVENPPELRLRVRRRAFALAHELVAAAPNPPVPAVLDWLEEIVKALSAAEPSAPTHDRQEAFFAPHEDVAARIIHALSNTRTSADLAVFTITDDRVSRAILDAHRRGVAIRIVSDNDKSADLGSDVDDLAKNGLAVRIDRTPVHMHHKFAILDGRVLLNGSYNWTRSASRENNENLVISRDPDLIAAFTREFERCWAVAEPL
jgi:phosphatidylserine/phosphatidylglycerophosphate/cardiolipin synthase-like enzyme